MESQKIINFLEHKGNPEKFYQTKKWYIINDQSNGQYNENSTIKINMEVIKENICEYGDAYILVTGNIKIIGGDAGARFCFKGISPFTRSVSHLSDTHIETAENLNLVMKHYNLIEYSDNYQDTVGSLYHFKRDEPGINNAGNLADANENIPTSFKYKLSLLTGLTSEVGGAGDNAYRSYKNAQIFVPLKYVSSFFRSLELPMINTKLHLELSWTKSCIMKTVEQNTNNDTNTFQVTKTEFYVPVVTLKTSDNEKLNDLLSSGFKRSVFWNEYKSKIETHTEDANNLKRIVLDSSFQRVNRLFVLAYDSLTDNKMIHTNSPKRYASPRVKLTKFNVLIEGMKFL